MANRYWVGGTAAWDGTAGTKWALTSGGAGGEAVPTSSDNVFFDAASGAVTVTVSAAGNCANLDFTGFTGTFAGASTLSIYGSLTFAAGMTRTYTGAITFNGTGSVTLTFNGITTASTVNFNSTSNTWTLQDAWNNGSSGITLTAGTLNTNGKAVTCGGFNIAGSTSRTLTLGASAITCDYWTASNTTNLTFNVGTSSITQVGAVLPFQGGGLTYNNVALTSTSTTSVGLQGVNTFANLTRTNASGYVSLTIYSNQTVTGTFTVTGNNANSERILVASDTIGTARTITAASVSLTNCDFRDITGAGAASPFTGTSIGNGGGNTNITPTTPVTRYWVGNGGNWVDPAHWSATSGGAGGASVPLMQDTARIDAASFSAGSQTITVLSSYALPTVDFTGVTNNPSFSGSSAINFYGSLTFASGMTNNLNIAVTFWGRGSHTITMAGKTWGFSTIITLNAPGGTYTLQDAFLTSSDFMLTAGTWNTNGQSFQAWSFTSTSGSTRSCIIDNSTVTLTGSFTVWNVTPSGLTFSATGSTIKLTNASSLTKTVVGGGLTYNNIWLTGTGTGAFQFTGSNTWNDFKCDTPPHTIQFTAGTTTTVATFTVSGTAGKLMTIESITASNHTLTKSGGGVINCDYLSVSRSTATPELTWNAGAHSIDGGNNSGWIFAASGPEMIRKGLYW